MEYQYRIMEISDKCGNEKKVEKSVKNDIIIGSVNAIIIGSVIGLIIGMFWGLIIL